MKKSMTVKILSGVLMSVLFLSNSVTTYAYCNHSWGKWIVIDEATCTESGEKYRYCEECYEEQTVTIPATGVHKWIEWKADGYLCEDGKWERYCTECYKEETKIRKGDGSHLWSDWEVLNEPDCLNEGKEYRKCYNCYEYEYRSIPVDNTKHFYGDWSYTKQPTIFENGLSTRMCYTCGNVETKEIPKLTANITLKNTKKTLKKGKRFTLKLDTWSDGDKIKSYKSSNKNIATVTSKGKVTAKKKGSTTITVTMKSGCTATCKVTVK